MKYSYAEITRLVSYLAGILVGLGFVAYGLVNKDLATAAAGAGMLGLGGLAGLNTNKTEVAPAEVSISDNAEVLPAPVASEEIATAGSDPAADAKHA